MKPFQRRMISTILNTAAVVCLLTAPNAHASITYPVIWGDNNYEWITNVNFGDINITSGAGTKGYADYTYDKIGITTRIRANGSYPLKVTIHPDTDTCAEYIYAFFDWNHDADFADAGETVAVINNTCLAGPHTVYVKVPSNAVPGETRMRIAVKYYSKPPSYGWIKSGEAEDYSVFVEYPAVIGDNRSEWITDVTLGEFTNPTGQEPDGYGDYTDWVTAKAIEVERNTAYNLGVTISPDVDWCEENVTAFLDWNHDGDFKDSGEKVVLAANTCDAGPHVVNLKVPLNAVVGMTRMRIVLQWKYAPAVAGYISGEVEDYTLLVQKGRGPWLMYLPAILGKGN